MAGVGSKEGCKKLKLRTSSDVISRLQWDESLPKSQFIVGYLDRFKGVVEKPFVALDWNDPAVVDNNTLALPKHRIVYFKYKNKKVWDKNEREDFIFGSTGSQMNIYDVMAEVDENEQNFFCEDETISEGDEDAITSTKVIAYDSEERPNFFVCARITDPETVKNLSKLSTHIKCFDPTLQDCCMTEDEYHLTLATLKLQSPEEINDAFVALSDLKLQCAPVPTVMLANLNVFHFRVLYACVKENEELMQLRTRIIHVLEEWKLPIMDKYAFVPHVTIAKTSRGATRLRHSSYIDQCSYIDYADDCFGQQAIDKLYLCEMANCRREDGFYMCAGDVSLN